MSRVWLGLGANIGDRNAALQTALLHIASLPDTIITKQSDIIETAPWGVTDQSAFLNMAIEIETMQQPVELLHCLLQIEENMGRVRTVKWGPRVIDIDILVYENIIMNTPELILPHPYMRERPFVMIPLRQIAPELIDLLENKH